MLQFCICSRKRRIWWVFNFVFLCECSCFDPTPLLICRFIFREGWVNVAYFYYLRPTAAPLLNLKAFFFYLFDFRHFNLRMKRDTTLFSPDLKVDVSGEEIPYDTSHIYTGEIFGKTINFSQLFKCVTIVLLL